MTETTTTDQTAEKKKAEKVSVTLTPPAALVRERDRAIAATRPALIATADDYAAAVAWLQQRKTDERRWAQQFLESRRPLVDAQRRAVQLEKDFLAPLREAIALVEGGVAAWRADQQAREAQLRKAAQAEAEAKAMAEREQQRKALEAAAKATPSRIEKKALRDQSAALAAAPVVVAPARIESTVPKVAGVFERVTWSAEVTDFGALLCAVAVPILLKRVLSEIDRVHEEHRAGDASVRIDELEIVRKWLAAQPTAVRDAVIPDQAWLDALAVRCQAEIPVPGVVGRGTTRTVVRGARDEV